MPPLLFPRFRAVLSVIAVPHTYRTSAFSNKDKILGFLRIQDSWCHTVNATMSAYAFQIRVALKPLGTAAEPLSMGMLKI